MGSGSSNAIANRTDSGQCNFKSPVILSDEIANLTSTAMEGLNSDYMARGSKGPKWIYDETPSGLFTKLNLLQNIYNAELALANTYLQVCKKYNGYMIPDVMAQYLTNANKYVTTPIKYAVITTSKPLAFPVKKSFWDCIMTGEMMTSDSCGVNYTNAATAYTKQEYINSINAQNNNNQNISIQVATIAIPCTQSYIWRQDGHSVQHSTYDSTRSQQVGFKQEMNESYFIEHNERMNEMNLAINDIRNRSTDYCSNPTTLLSTSGMDTCGMNTAWGDMMTNITPATDASKKSLSSIQDTDDYLQYNIAKSTNDELVKINNYNPMDSTKKMYNVYNNIQDDLTVSTSTMKQQNDYISLNTKYAKDSYNNCALPENTLLSTNNDNIPNCVQSKYVPATNTCSKAIQMSKKYDYEPGTTALTGLWEDVTNNIPGNRMSTTTTVLANSNDSCQKWVDMFNIWEEKERVAMSTPCSPERPIASTNDKTLINVAENWHSANGKLIDSLIARLKVIETYVQNYPNILEMKPSNIQFAPSSLPATVMLTQTKNKAGVAPTQNINMIIPNGTPGKMGEQGYIGIVGDNSLPGVRGPDGKRGNPALPQ